MTEIRIPSLGVSMSEGLLADWLVDDGATVSEGDPLYLLETEKVETEIESPQNGVLHHIGAKGETYQVGDVVGEIT